MLSKSFGDKSEKGKVKVPSQIGLVYEFAPRISPFPYGREELYSLPREFQFPTPVPLRAQTHPNLGIQNQLSTYQSP